MGNRFSFLRVFSLLVFLYFAFSGCSTYQNMTAYFNTYYNAKKLYGDAESELRQSPQKDRDTNAFAAYSVPQPTQAKFDKVVEKCSKLIQFYPGSSWVDDAILMIAKSDMYLGDHESSVRKCKELQENFSTSGLRFDARLIEAEDEYLMKKDDKALQITKDLVPELRNESKQDLLLEALMLQAQIYADRREYDQAAQNYDVSLEVPGDGAVKAFAAFQLGSCYEKVGDTVKAADAYARVRKFSPTFDLEYRARLKYGEMLAASGKYDRALGVLDDLNSEALKPEQHGLVDLEIANTYRSMGDTAVAFSLYNLIDTVYRHTEASGKSLYLRGLYYEKTLHDYKTSRAYYLLAKNESQSGEFSLISQRKANSLDRYFTLGDNLKRYEAALHHDTSMSKNASADSGRSQVSVVTKVDTSARGESGGVASEEPADLRLPDIANDVVPSPADEGLGGASAAYRRRHADRDLEPDDESQGGAQPVGPAGGTKSGKLAEGRDSTSRARRAAPAVKVEQLSPDSVRSLIAQSYYELGTLFYLELEQPDSARRWYYKLVDEYPNSHFLPRTLYALTELYRGGSDSSLVDSLYNVILNRFGESVYATQVKKIRGMKVDTRELDVTEAKFQKGEDSLQAGNANAALKEFRAIALDKKRSPLTSKAEYAVGWIYESVLFENDSAEVWYKRLMKEDSTSVYALAVTPKVRVKEKPESLKQFVKVKEIEQMSKTDKPQRRRPTGDVSTDPNQGDDEIGRPGRTQQLQDDDSDSPDDDEDIPDPDDDSDDNNL